MATNTATYTGELGVVKYDVSGTMEAVAEIRGFTIDQEQATLENTVMGDTVRSYLPSLSQFSGSLDVYFRDDDTAANALFAGIGAGAASIEVYPSGETTGVKLSGDIIITGHSISSNFDGMVEASVSFQGVKDSSGNGLTKTNL
jgi:predicted secreted protein